MTPLELLTLGLVIGANNLAVALALGALGQVVRRSRVVAVFGVTEFLVPLVGIAIGRSAAGRLASGADLLGAALLVAFGVWAVVQGRRRSADDERLAGRATTWHGLLLLAGGLSLDNLVVGFGLGLGQVDPVVVATAIGVSSAVVTWVGLALGDHSRRHWERPSAVVAGGLLVVLGVATGLGLL